MVQKNFLILFLFFSIFQCWAQASFEIINPRVDAGDVCFDSLTVSAVVYYTNQGTAPLYLTSAVTFCPCTKVEFSTEALAPGDTAQIIITHRMEHVGPFNQSARICYFDPDDETAAKYVSIFGTAIIEKKED